MACARGTFNVRRGCAGAALASYEGGPHETQQEGRAGGRPSIHQGRSERPVLPRGRLGGGRQGGHVA
eukprot:7062152-Pyramimonas_sp.AAC.1